MSWRIAASRKFTSKAVDEVRPAMKPHMANFCSFIVTVKCDFILVSTVPNCVVCCLYV